MKKKKNCFVIMPFGGKFDEYYLNIYKPAIESCGLIARRADDIYKSSPIINDIWNYVLTADIIVADLSDKNPNVMYELGLAHAIAKPVVLLSNSIDTVPFDLKYMRILLYDSIKSDWSTTLKTTIKKYILETLESPMETVLPTFLKVEPNKSKTISALGKDILDIKQTLNQILSETNDLKSNNSKHVTSLSDEQYQMARKYANKMYFDEGLDLADIKDSLCKEYNINIAFASDIVNAAIR